MIPAPPHPARPIKTAATAGQGARCDVVAGRQHLGAKLLRRTEQIVKLDRHIAVDAGHRRLAIDVALREAVDDRFPEAPLIVEHVVRNADAFGDGAGVVNVLTGAAGTLAMRRRAVVVKLQRDADDVITFRLQQRSRHR